MSQPKRFDFWMYQKPCEYFGIRATMQMEFSENGRCVSWDDYAALAAENERLRSKLSFSQSISEICKQTQEGETITVQGSISSGKTILADLFEVEQLRAENERLRKAGDRLAFHAQEDGTGWELHDAAKAWLAAKEGREAASE